MVSWRRFRPRRPVPYASIVKPTNIFEAAEQLIRAMVANEASPRRLDYKQLDDIVANLEMREPDMDASMLVIKLAQLIARTPRAARAQAEMDRHHGGYRNRKARLFELIDFNDTFVDTVLVLPPHELVDFTANLHQSMKHVAKLFRAPMFSDKQYEAITHGLSREIAVYRTAQQAGYQVEMTNRSDDAKGIDMIISDQSTGVSMAIDCKTRSSFHFRLLDLTRDGYVTEEERLRGELTGFHVLRRGRQKGLFRVTTLLRVSTRDLGPIEAFAFEDPGPFLLLLQRAMQEQTSS